MKGFVFVLLLLYTSITILWIVNSPLLHSLWGIMIWIILIVIGFIAYYQITKNSILKLLILYSCYFMVFLVCVTGIIHVAVSSMP
ncbi:putative membrane protein [Metabacillus malikii]|uniref:Membrane protein n=1 Tax=Metabacillus malikii TaxID=1504265 RepID=A0ABT9ZL13_9BACI|nr:putative membrane protein [Metabacillus malikii]